MTDRQHTRRLILNLLESADALRDLAAYPRGAHMSQGGQGEHRLVPVLVELIEAWCLEAGAGIDPEIRAMTEQRPIRIDPGFIDRFRCMLFDAAEPEQVVRC